MIEVVPALLEARHIRKAFGGAVALRNATLIVRPGEIHALLGENGAGKSTLIKCLAGTPPPDSGTIVVEGRTLPPQHGPGTAMKAGLAFIHQESTLIEDLTVEENMAIVEGYPRRFGLIDWTAVKRRAREALEALDISIDPRARVAELPLASRTTVAIARALALSAKLLVLDEPTASLGAKGVSALFSALRHVSAAGNGIVFVSHRLDEVYNLCDRVTVLRDGADVGTASPGTLSRGDMVAMICGHHVTFKRKGAPPPASSPVIEAKALSGGMVAPVSFEVGPGEIVGFTGLSDAGHYDLGAMLFGLAPILEGSLSLDREAFRPGSPAAAIERGVGYVPPDRNRDGLAREMTLAENLFLNPARGSPARDGSRWLWGPREGAAAASLLKRFSVRPPLPDARVGTLSGGNAQKVLLARWLSSPARLLVINDVSVGVDVGAREDIYAAIREAAAAGTAIMIVTSDFEEIENLCSRALVFVRGVLRAELLGDDVTISGVASFLAGVTQTCPATSDRGVSG